MRHDLQGRVDESIAYISGPVTPADDFSCIIGFSSCSSSIHVSDLALSVFNRTYLARGIESQNHDGRRRVLQRYSS